MYGTVDLDNYMYLKSKNSKYIDISQKSIATTSKSIKCGRLYNWYAATDPRGIAPEGWHVPTKSEWEMLNNFLGVNAGVKLKSVGINDWAEAPQEFIGTNESNFNAYPTEFAYLDPGTSELIFYPQPSSNFTNHDAYFLSSTESGITNFIIEAFRLSFYETTLDNVSLDKNSAGAIRLIKDNSINEGDIIIDGDTYHSITIGSQVWLQQNLATRHYKNGDLIGSDFTGTDGAVIAYNIDEGNVYNNPVIELYPIISGNILYDTILDNPIDADRFNGTNTLDVLDLEFPCEESLIQPIIDLCLKEVSAINGIPRDTTNNASDDSSLPKQQ